MNNVIEIGFTSNQLKDLKQSYEDLRHKTLSMEKANALIKLINKMNMNKKQLKQLVDNDIPFLSGLALNRLIKYKK